jgi:CDP-glucose 4,6-dehydratase
VEDVVNLLEVDMGLRGLFGGAFAGRKVLVTGHTGFKGTWLCLWLRGLGASVLGYSLEPPTTPSAFQAVHLDSLITSIHGDVRECDRVARVFDDFRPELVFHLAAQPLVRYSYREPRMTYETNVMGTVNVLEAVRQTASVKALIVVTSDKCYQNQEWDYSYRENDPMGGYDPYSSSKGCAELVTAAYRTSFFGKPGAPSVISVRAGNVVGGGDWAADRLIPDCIRALQAHEPVKIRNPKAVRPWQHVLEPLSGYLLLAGVSLAQGQMYSGAWNFGPGAKDHITVADMVTRVIGLWGEGEWHVDQAGLMASHEAKLLKLDCTKASSQLGWYPVYRVDETLKATVDWYRHFYRNGGDMYAHSMKDIRDFASAAAALGLSWAT